MKPDVGNPLLDHLLARMVFNITRHMNRGCMAMFELPDASDLEFCAEQLEAIEKDEEIDPRIRRIHIPMTNGRLDQAKLRGIRTSAIERDLLDVVLIHQGVFSMTYVAHYHIFLNAEGEMLIKKNRDGATPNEFIPYEAFEYANSCQMIEQYKRACSGTP